MTSEIRCPSCGKTLRIKSTAKRIRCPVCQTEMSLAVSAVAASSPPPPPPLGTVVEVPPEVQPEPAYAPEPPLSEFAPQIHVSKHTARGGSTRGTAHNKPTKEVHPAIWAAVGSGGAALLVGLLVGLYYLTQGESPSTTAVTQVSKTGSKSTTKRPPADEDEAVSAEDPFVPAPPNPRTPPPFIPPAPSQTIPPPTTNEVPIPITPAEPVTVPEPMPEIPATVPMPTTPETTPPATVPEPMPTVPDPATAPPKPETTPEKTEPEKAPPAKSPKGPVKKPPTKPGAKTPGGKAGGPPAAAVATADCDQCRTLGVVPLTKPQPYVWLEGTPVPQGKQAVREQFCPRCKPDADNAVLAAAEDARLKTAIDAHLQWEKKTNWPLVRVETRHIAIHSQLPPQDTARVGLAIETMTQHIQQLTGSVELTPTTPANCDMIITWQKPNYLQLVDVFKNDPVYGPARPDGWSLVRDVSGTWVKEVIFYMARPEGPPPEHQAVSLLSSYQIRSATSYRDPSWLNVGYSAYCENATLHANRCNTLEYALNNLQIDPDWSLSVRRLAAAGGLKTWADMFPKLLRDYQAEDHLTAYAMVAFLIEYQPRKFLDFVKEIKGGLGAEEALEKAYGEKVPQLQQRWVRALAGGR